MALWHVALIGLLGFGAASARKDARKKKAAEEEDQRRMNTPFRFEGKLTEADFRRIASRASKGFKRIRKVSFSGPVIEAVVRSQSGASEWSFKVDFNDYGKMTDSYWLYSDNDDSSIPQQYADRVLADINNFLNFKTYHDYYDNQESQDHNERKAANAMYCPNCYEPILNKGAVFCTYCGIPLQGADEHRKTSNGEYDDFEDFL